MASSLKRKRKYQYQWRQRNRRISEIGVHEMAISAEWRQMKSYRWRNGGGASMASWHGENQRISESEISGWLAKIDKMVAASAKSMKMA